jgi:hypothetical protein
MLNGLVGVGGGILIVPGLMLVRGLPPQTAVSTSLGSVLIISAVALGVHLIISGLHFNALGILVLLAAGIGGAQLGGFLLKRLSPRWVILVFAVMVLVSALQLIAVAVDLLPALVSGLAEPPLWSYPVLGVFGGTLSGLLGIGGGGLVVLGFSVLFHTPVLGGLPVALAINVTNSLSGVIAQRNTGRILWREVRALVPSALLGVLVGAGLAVLLPPNVLRIVFALFFVFMGCQLILRATKG